MVATAMVAFTAVPNANAQIELIFGGGLSSPMGEYGDQTNTGWAFTTGLGFQVAPVLVVGAELGFFGNSGSDDLLAGFSPGTEMKTTIHQYAGFARLMLPAGKHNVFAKGVVGSYRGVVKVKSPLGDAEAENTDPGFGIGGGILINGAHNTAFVLDAMYHRVSYDGAPEPTSLMTFSVGGIFRFSLSD
jgi:hypothetical protein